MKYLIVILIVVFLSSCSKRLAEVTYKGKWGCIDKRGDFMVKPEWDYILQGYKRNDLILVERDSLYGYVNKKGRVLIKPQYDEANLFLNGLAAVSNGEKYGFINIKGDTILPFVYDNVSDGFRRGLCDVTINDSSGYINKKGEVVIPLIYNICYEFKYKYATVMTFDRDPIFILVDKKGKIYDYDKLGEKRKLYPPRYAYPGSIKTNTGYGRVNKKGDTIVPPIYNTTGNLINGMYIVKDKKNKFGAYNKKGKVCVPIIFESINHFHRGLAVIKLNGKYGYVNKKGKIVIQPIYDGAVGFSKGLACVTIGNKRGYINKKGEIVIPPIFELSNMTGSFE